MAAADESQRKPSGFQGGMVGLDLPDLVQLNAARRFSGCIRVRSDDREGLIFFRDGDVVHAEQGGRAGEEAFSDILEWPRGTFDADTSVMAAHRTIHKKWEHLLLDAHRVIDERRAKGSAPAPPPSAGTAPAPKGGTVDVVRALPDVSGAVILTLDGQRVGEGGPQEETLAGKVAYLALLGAEFGTLFQAGQLRAATVQASLHHLLLYVTRSHYLGVSTEPEADPDVVDAAIRSALTKGR
ncbi:MAG TPA: DUF4388 domain-containing protein [Anaeromyxobacteraceae bacterium]|nr:DUF4388 domain-containing protein [Anaeromyxobacteraceae bacterium]